MPGGHANATVNGNMLDASMQLGKSQRIHPSLLERLDSFRGGESQHALLLDPLPQRHVVEDHILALPHIPALRGKGLVAVPLALRELLVVLLVGLVPIGPSVSVHVFVPKTQLRVRLHPGYDFISRNYGFDFKLHDLK